MIRENAVKWIEALRSGEYKQGANLLKDTVDGQTYHCCLGVYCELFGMDTIHDDGIPFEMPHVPIISDNDDAVLASMNDGLRVEPSDDTLKLYAESKLKGVETRMEPYTFNEIADVLEENLDVICKEESQKENL